MIYESKLSRLRIQWYISILLIHVAFNTKRQIKQRSKEANPFCLLTLFREYKLPALILKFCNLNNVPTIVIELCDFSQNIFKKFRISTFWRRKVKFLWQPCLQGSFTEIKCFFNFKICWSKGLGFMPILPQELCSSAFSFSIIEQFRPHGSEPTRSWLIWRHDCQ